MKFRIRRAKGTTEPQPAVGALPFSAVHDNVVLADDGLWAVYKLKQIPYLFVSPREQLAAVEASQQRWSELAGHRVKLRVTAHAFPHAAWAEALDQAHPNRLPDVDGAETWADYLAVSQYLSFTAQCITPVTYLMVRITTQKIPQGNLRVLLGDGEVSEQYRRIRSDLARVTDVVARDGLNGEPAKTRAIAWLTHTSLALGLPAPDVSVDADQITARDAAVFTGPVEVESTPYAPHATVHAMRGGEAVTQHVTVLSMGAVEDRDQIGRLPWLAWPRNQAFPVELVATFDVYGGDAVRATAERSRKFLRDQQLHYADHGEEPPTEVQRALDAARQMEDETSAGTPEVACRLIGPVRAALVAANPDDLARNVREFIANARRDQRIEWVHSHGQAKLLEEFVPCAGPALPGFERWIPAAFMGTALPNVGSRSGTPGGPLLGWTLTGATEAVLLQPTHGPRTRRSGLAFFIGDPGSGKSTAQGIVMEHALRLGHQGIIFDPSGPLARLAELPYLRRHSRVIDLSKANPGTLNPYSLVPQPRRDDFPVDPANPDGEAAAEQAFRAALAGAQAERRELMADTVAMLLPSSMLTGAAGGDTINRVRDAVWSADAGQHSSPWQVIDKLREQGPGSKSIARVLEAAAAQVGSALLFPSRDSDGDDLPVDARFTVITFPNITPPAAGSDRAHWTWSEQMSAPVFHLAGKFAARAMYANRDPKVILTDEAALTGSGAASLLAFFDRGARDSRKWNALFGIASQNPADFLPISTQVSNLAGPVFAGRMRSPEAAEAALHLARVPVTEGHIRTLMGLQTGQFLLRDWDNTNLVQIALDHRPHLAEVLNTTPDRHQPATFNPEEAYV